MTPATQPLQTFLEPRSFLSRALGHELVHVGQYRTGELTRSRYIRELLKHGSGTKTKFEAPAYGLQDEITFSLPALLKAFGDKGPVCGCEQ